MVTVTDLGECWRQRLLSSRRRTRSGSPPPSAGVEEETWEGGGGAETEEDVGAEETGEEASEEAEEEVEEGVEEEEAGPRWAVSARSVFVSLPVWPGRNSDQSYVLERPSRRRSRMRLLRGSDVETPSPSLWVCTSTRAASELGLGSREG